MTAAVDATSYGLVELSGEDQIKQQEELIKELDEPDTIDKLIECKKTGQSTVTIDCDFIRVKLGMILPTLSRSMAGISVRSNWCSPAMGWFYGCEATFSILVTLE